MLGWVSKRHLSFLSPLAIVGAVALLNLAAGRRDAAYSTIRSLIEVIPRLPVVLCTTPVLVFPGWFLRDLARRSRRPGFALVRARLLLVGLCAISVVTFGLFMWPITGLCLLVFGTVLHRLGRPRSPWPRLLRAHATEWLKEAAGLGFGFAVLVHHVARAPMRWVPWLSVGAFLAVLSFRLRQAARSHERGPLDLPDECTLLLRAFGYDDEPFGPTRRGGLLHVEQPTGFTQFVAAAAKDGIAPLVALGDPRDLESSGGAVRYYVSDASWRGTFQALLPRARAILLPLTALTDNLRWELDQLRRCGAHTRLYLFTHPARPTPGAPSLLLRIYRGLSHAMVPGPVLDMPSTDYRTAARVLRGLGYAMPDDPGPGAVIAFGQNAAAHVLLRNGADAEAMIAAIAARMQRVPQATELRHQQLGA
jgi:hypothetical protein